MPTILSFDLGTTYFKAVLFDDAGRILALGRRATPIQSPRDGWREIPVDEFQSTIAGLIGDLREAAPDGVASITGISFATQANSFALLDGDGRALTPFILWSDRRAEAEPMPEVERIAALPRFTERTGVPGLSGGFMIAKLLWLERQHPGTLAKAKQVRLISDYFTQWLTGNGVTEAGTSGLTGLLDIHTLQWMPDALAIAGLDESQLARPVRAGTLAGPLQPDVADALGLPRSAKFVVGCLDQYAGPIGAGNVATGQLTETTGTVLATVALVDRYEPEPSPAVFQGPSWQPGFYWRMCFGEVSASLLEAYARQQPDKPDYDALTREAANVPADAAATMDGAKSVSAGKPVFNDGSNPSRGAQVRGILQGVADALHDQIAMLYGSARPTAITSVGGAARSDFWLQLKANTIGLPVTAIQCPEPTSLGAANLAAAALTGAPLATIARAHAQVRARFEPA